MRRAARVGGVSSISGAIESRGAFSVGAGVGPGYLSGGREGGGGGGRPLSRATAPEPEGSMSDTSPDLLVNI